MNIKRNIIFALENRKKDGIPITQNVPIRMRVVFASQRIEFTTGYRIDMEKWDADKQRVRNGCTNKLKQSASEINTELLRQYTEIQNVFKEFEVQDIMPTPAQIKEAFNLKMKGEKEESHHEKEEVKLDFMKIFDEFVAECSKQNDWSSSTLKKFATVKKHIATFDPNTTFESWTERHFNEYIDYLRSDKDMRNTSIAKQIKFLKWFLRWTNRKGYHQNTAYDKFMPKMKSAPKKVIFLTRNELDKIRACQIPAAKQYLERVRDGMLCMVAGLAAVVIGALKFKWGADKISATFLVVCLLIGCVSCKDINVGFNRFIKGCASTVGAAFIVGFANCLTVLMSNGMILDTIVYWLAKPISHMGAVLGAGFMFLANALINFFISSGSGQAAAVMPIMVPIADLTGITRQVAVQAFQFGDGFTNCVIPTIGTLMGGLGFAGISYGKYLKKAMPLILVQITLAFFTLMFLQSIGWTGL